jgi:hypothetical protein
MEPDRTAGWLGSKQLFDCCQLVARDRDGLGRLNLKIHVDRRRRGVESKILHRPPDQMIGEAIAAGVRLLRVGSVRSLHPVEEPV